MLTPQPVISMTTKRPSGMFPCNGSQPNRRRPPTVRRACSPTRTAPASCARCSPWTASQHTSESTVRTRERRRIHRTHIAVDNNPIKLGVVDIRVERRAVGLSQSQLARAAGVPQPNLSAYENGRRVPSPEVLERINRALKVRPSTRVQQHRDSIRAIVAEHHAVAPRIFGSVARGDDEPGSDVDLLVEFTDEASLLDEIGLRNSRICATW